MQILHIFDDQNYDPSWPNFCREAVRAIIVRDGQIAMIKSEKEGYYKFPGGGIEPGESKLEALIRETQEESGLQIIPDSVREFGMLWEKRRGLYQDEIFSQKSYYYPADFSHAAEQNLDAYEAALGYGLEWTDVETAYQVNSELGRQYETSFILREAYILKLLLERQ